MGLSAIHSNSTILGLNLLVICGRYEPNYKNKPPLPYWASDEKKEELFRIRYWSHSHNWRQCVGTCTQSTYYIIFVIIIKHCKSLFSAFKELEACDFQISIYVLNKLACTYHFYQYCLCSLLVLPMSRLWYGLEVGPLGLNLRVPQTEPTYEMVWALGP